MRCIFQFSKGLAGIVLILAMNGTPVRAQAFAPKPDTPDVKAQADAADVNKLLSEAKWHAALADYDSETLFTFTYRTDFSWQTHSAQLETMKGHVNNLGKVVNELNVARFHAAPWQQVAIDRINPMLNDMATNLNAAINYLRNNENRINSPEYRDYLRASADLASRTSTTISEFVEYGKDNQSREALQRRLELPSK